MISGEQKHILSWGRVPAKRRHQFKRKIAQDFNAKMSDFLKDDGDWLIVHGMPGIGKTSLVSSALWERPEFSLAFSNRVLWITDRSLDVEKLGYLANDALLLLTLNTQTSSFDSDFSTNLQVIGHKLRFELEKSSTKTLIVLDGVMRSSTVEFFEENKGNNCKIIATTTSQEIFSALENATFFKIGPDNLDIEEMVLMMSNFGLSSASFSPSQLEEILEKTGGNLAILEKLFTIAAGNSRLFPALLHRLKNRPLEELGCTSSYQYSSIDLPISIAYQLANERVGKSFAMCGAIEPFKWTQFEIWSLIWPVDVCGSETNEELNGIVAQDLGVLVAHSLLDDRSNTGLRYPTVYPREFRLHPLVHSFIVHNQPHGYSALQQSCKSLLLLLKLAADPSNIQSDYFKKNEARLEQLRSFAKAWTKNKKLNKNYNSDGLSRNDWSYSRRIFHALNFPIRNLISFLCNFGKILFY